MNSAHLHPKAKPTPKHWYTYDVEYEGDLIVTDSRDPEHDLARALLARGIKGHVRLIGPGCSGASIHRTTVNIEKAAKLTADGNSMKVRPWKPYPAGTVRGYSPEEPLVLTTMPTEASEAA